VAAGEIVEKLRAALDGLNERERRLLAVLGAVTVAVVVILPLYLVAASVSDLADQNQQTQEILRDIARARNELAQRRVEREAARELYANKAPALGGYLEAEASEQSLTLRDVTDQPEVVLGDFTRRNIRASLPHVQIRPVVKMLTELENSPYPLIVERIEVDSVRGVDDYNVRVGVSAYDRGVPGGTDSDAQGPRRTRP
jgi:type II secretory pathway component PulM